MQVLDLPHVITCTSLTAQHCFSLQEPHRQDWELFTLEYTPDGMIGLITTHGTYISATPAIPFGKVTQVGTCM